MMSIFGKNLNKKNNIGIDGYSTTPDIGHITAKPTGYRLIHPLI
jgi:hypothetical protein